MKPLQTPTPDCKQIVFVTQDESTFQASDYQKHAWIHTKENFCLPKSPGRSIMVSEFQCPCHGTMRATINNKDLISRVLFYPGKGYDGYWTSQHMVNQLDDVLLLFNHLHENKQAVFLFDQSSNHKAFSDNALVASRFTHKPHEIEKNEAIVRKGFYYKTFDINREHRITQNLYETKTYDFCEAERIQNSHMKTSDKINAYTKLVENPFPGGIKKTYFKGIRSILRDRGIYNGQNRFCDNVANADHDCCGVHLLGFQQDFLEQRSILQEKIENAGHLFELYPRFHCECNWIERYWGAAKKIARQNCSYNFKSLQKNLNPFLDSVCDPKEEPLLIRRFFNKSFRYIEAYSQEKDAETAFEIVKQFSKTQKSHRKLRLGQ
ncbi:hypothetical protein BD770DRAFT_454675 [Pilaira anomala]|nr:hypothetical protein BD770DRAFT_454675 [Pilaira anomala]